jgi:hypothetical protein
MFEDDLRAAINDAPFQSEERQLLKTVLGEYLRGKSKDGYAFVQNMINVNTTMLNRLHSEHPRREEYLEENRVLKKLLK